MGTMNAARAALAGLLLLAAPAARSGPLERTDPGHMAPLPPGGYDLPLSPPVMRFPLPPQWVTIRVNQDWRTAGRIDKELSKACAERRFRELLPMRFRAIFKRDVLGVAFGHGLNLRDEGKLADPRMIYLFRNGDSTGCIVVAMTNEDARLLQRIADEEQRVGAPGR
ncbi:hypothetical protein [Azospirillum halopraeferens]|uniref:hypothetical protein n=1 Tax=Azospirillum halopraeferens TaxID=34010 RepID=UPI000428D5E2|nr:hypothetical protein [Azospirillum halopraeferens]